MSCVVQKKMCRELKRNLLCWQQENRCMSRGGPQEKETFAWQWNVPERIACIEERKPINLLKFNTVYSGTASTATMKRIYMGYKIVIILAGADYICFYMRIII